MMNTILFLNHKKKQCGVYQYGIRLYSILQKCDTYHYMYIEVESYEEYNTIVSAHPKCKCIMYNYHSTTMTWLHSSNIQRLVKNIGIPHESSFDIFDSVCNIDPNGIETSTIYNIPRPIYEHVDTMLTNYEPSTSNIKDFIHYSEPNVPIFGSFGFGFMNKGFDKIVQYVNEQCDRAIIKLVITTGDYVPGSHETNNTLRQLFDSINDNTKITLMITHDFFSVNDVLYFLRSNTMNIFMHDTMHGRGISSVIDYAISVKRPLAISDSYMFRNIYSDEICLYKNSISSCIERSVNYYTRFLTEYTHVNVLSACKHIVDCVSLLTYSQSYQDIFVASLTNGKHDGYFLEIGSNDPITHNNSYLMESKYNWRGTLVEYDKSFEYAYKQYRPRSNYILQDATTVHYREHLDLHNYPTEMDYLQIDLDVDNSSTITTLQNLDATVFDKYKFATVTFETDIYRGNFFDTQTISREIFKNRGYILLFPNVSVYWEGEFKPFEDWYVHPDLVDMEFVREIQSNMTDDTIRNVDIIRLLSDRLPQV